MKKHIIRILIIVLILALLGTGAWIFVRRNKVKSLYQANCDFVVNEDSSTLISKMTYAQNLYSAILSSESRLTTLQTIIIKMDEFEKDLNSYLVLSTAKAYKTKKLSKSYSSLIKSRKTLINNYDEYITRMSGDINADGPAIQILYNNLFNKTVDYLYSYNNCFQQTSNYVFSKVYKADSIKSELYTMYSLGVTNLLNNISNNKFSSTTLITKLNNGITLFNGNIKLVDAIKGGEFSVEALNFKKYFNNSDLSILINNFNTYYNSTINLDTETSNEKLAIYYAKLILEI